MDQSSATAGEAREHDATQAFPQPPVWVADSVQQEAGQSGPPSLPGSPEHQVSEWPHPQTQGWQEDQPSGESFGALPGYPSPSTTDEAARRTGRLIPLFMAALLGAVLGTGATLVANDRLGGSGAVSKRVVDSPVPGGTDNDLSGIAKVAQAVTPSIVFIRTVVRGAFGNQTASGSGVIYREDGYIITNNHVVAGARDVEVTLASGDTLEGRVIGTAAPIDDIAIVKVDRSGLPAATLGSIRTTKVGELAIAIGSPFGLQGTVTAGIVSALHRSIDLGDAAFTEAIQTDAPINPGNSGGALVNGRGEVIGINTAIVGGAGGNVGIGFAIPIDIAERDADEIIETGVARRPLLGIFPRTIPNQTGAYVAEVTAGGPAGRAGIRIGDVITKINDTAIATGEDLILAITQFRVGQQVKIEFTRDGKRSSATAVLIART